jgi:hypothetical protein
MSRRMRLPRLGSTAVAVDGTSFTPGAIRPLFVKRAKVLEEGFTWCFWLKSRFVLNAPTCEQRMGLIVRGPMRAER